MKQILRTSIITALILLSPFCYSQQNDSICFAYSDARKILILANKGKQVDSLIFFYDSRIDLLNEMVSAKDGQLIVAGELISKQSILISDLTARLSESERKKKNLKNALIGSLGLIVIEAVVIFI